MVVLLYHQVPIVVQLVIAGVLLLHIYHSLSSVPTTDLHTIVWLSFDMSALQFEWSMLRFE